MGGHVPKCFMGRKSSCLFQLYETSCQKTARGGAFSSRIFLLNPGKAKHMLFLAILTCLWKAGRKRQPSNELCDTDVLCPEPHSQMLWLQGSSLHNTHPGLSLESPLWHQPRKMQRQKPGTDYTFGGLPRGDFFPLIRIHYHKDGRFSH